MNEKTYEQLLQYVRLEIQAMNAEFNARLLAAENRIAEMEDERRYERDLLLSNLDTQEAPIVDWSAQDDD